MSEISGQRPTDGVGPRAGVGAPGESLHTIFERARALGVALPTPIIFSLFIQTCDELAHAGRRRPKHRGDPTPEAVLSPRRILVRPDGGVTVDWSTPEQEPSPDVPLSYKSPEQMRGLPTNSRSDLFSLALCIAELLVLKRLSNGGGALAETEGGRDLVALLRQGKRVPRELGSLLVKSLAHDVERRPFGVTSFLEDLRLAGLRIGLQANPALVAEELRALFSARVAAPQALSQVEEARDEDLVLAPSPPEDWGDLEVFADLEPPPASRATPEIPPPPPSMVPEPKARARATPRSTPPPLPLSPELGAAPPTSPAHLPPPRTPPPPLGDSRLPAPRPVLRPSEVPPGLARTVPPARLSAAIARFGGVRKRLTGFGLGAVLAVPAFASWRLLAAGPATIFTSAVTSQADPVARVLTSIDGAPACNAARCELEATPGVHEIAVRADGYAPQSQLVAVRSRDTLALNFRLERIKGSVRVTGLPVGASVFVDGEHVGSLPAQVELSPGRHHLRVAAEGRLAEERVVDLALGEALHLTDLSLRPLRGRATIDIRTPGADVSLLSDTERKEHLARDSSVELDLSHAWFLEARRPGFLPLHQPLEWDGAIEKTFVVSLEPAWGRRSTHSAGAALRDPVAASGAEVGASGGAGIGASARSGRKASAADDTCTLSFNSIPVSSVILDGERVGTTPILHVSTRAGSHAVQFVAGDAERSKSITCRPGETEVVTARIER